MGAVRTLITSDMLRPNTPDEIAMHAEFLALDPDDGIDWVDIAYETEAERLNTLGIPFEEWEKGKNARVAAWVAQLDPARLVGAGVHPPILMQYATPHPSDAGALTRHRPPYAHHIRPRSGR